MDAVRTLIGIGAIGSGVYGIGMGVRAFLEIQAASSWPTVRGRVVSASTESHNTGNNAGRGVYHVARITYEYECGGRRFTGTRLRPGGDVWIGSWSAEDIVRRYPVGSDVDVSTNPADPAQACIEPAGGAWIVNIVAGLVALGIGVFLLLGGAGR